MLPRHLNLETCCILTVLEELPCNELSFSTYYYLWAPCLIKFIRGENLYKLMLQHCTSCNQVLRF